MKFPVMKSLVLVAFLAAGLFPAAGRLPVSNAAVDYKQFVPVLVNNSNSVAGKTVANAPYFQVADVAAERFSGMGILWYGQVNSRTNYSDARIGYNDTALYIHVATIDKYLFNNPASDGSGLESWDAVTLLLDLNGGSTLTKPGSQSYRFVVQLRNVDNAASFQAAYRGDGSQWVRQSVPFTSSTTWRSGTGINNGSVAHGWWATIKIPFASLGFSGRPVDGRIWRMALMTHDRDTQAGPALPDQVWPAEQNRDQPASWAQIRFGLPVYKTPSVSNIQTTVIQQGFHGAAVKDTAAGGGFNCGTDIGDDWELWGIRNYGGATQFNIQNQRDVSDWPCFSKYFVTFPLDAIPSGKVIRSAKLIMHYFSGSNPAEANTSRIQVLRVGQEWNEATLTWNNAPYALENGSYTLVEVYRTEPIVWENIPAPEWDVSRLVSQAYSERSPLRLALYSADSAIHSGKYFVSSETWLPQNRPTLIVEWGDP